MDSPEEQLLVAALDVPSALDNNQGSVGGPILELPADWITANGTWWHGRLCFVMLSCPQDPNDQPNRAAVRYTVGILSGAEDEILPTPASMPVYARRSSRGEGGAGGGGGG